MKRKGYKKIILATLISVLLIGSAGAVYATQPYVSEKLILSEETVDAHFQCNVQRWKDHGVEL